MGGLRDTDRAAGTTLAVRRCPWCAVAASWRDNFAWRKWGTCRHCADLERLSREACGRPLRDELRQAARRR